MGKIGGGAFLALTFFSTGASGSAAGLGASSSFF